MLPINVYLVRHGQSEGNQANRMAEKGDESGFSPDFRARHTSSWRLTDTGRHQAYLAGIWIRENLLATGQAFGWCVTSAYFRAMETAALLALPGAEWQRNFFLTERDWGYLEACPPSERIERFADALRSRTTEPFFWRPPNGESFAQLCLRVDRGFDTLHRQCSDMEQVILVCHGEVMRAVEVNIEKPSSEEFRRRIFSKDPADQIHNCQITHYTRRNPMTGEILPYMGWKRYVRPTITPAVISPWKEVERKKYTNQELLEMVSFPTLSIF